MEGNDGKWEGAPELWRGQHGEAQGQALVWEGWSGGVGLGRGAQ